MRHLLSAMFDPWALHLPVLESLTEVVVRKIRGEAQATEFAGAGAARAAAMVRVLDECGAEARVIGSGVHVSPKAYDDDGPGRDPEGGSSYGLVGSVAVVPVAGVIAKYASEVNGQSTPQGTSIERLRQKVAAIKDDGRARSILFVADTPGGSVAQVFEFGQELRAERSGGIPTEWYSSDLTASAGQWLASQTTRITTNPMGFLGSIGVYAPVIDASKAFEQRGWKMTVVSSGGLKGHGVWGSELSQEYMDEVKARVMQWYTTFVGEVAIGRGISTEDVMRVADGRVWKGTEAISRRLADAIGSAGEVVRRMDEQYGARRVGARVDGLRGETLRGTGEGRALPAIEEVVAKVERVAPPVAPEQTKEGTAGVLLAGNGGEAAGDDGMRTKLLLAAAGLAAALLSPEAQGGGGGGSATADAEAIKKAREEAKEEGKLAERARAKAIREAAAGFAVEGLAAVVEACVNDENCTADTARVKIMDHVKAAMKPVGQVAVGREQIEKLHEAAGTVLSFRLNPAAEQALRQSGFDSVSGVDRSERSRRVAQALGFDSPDLALRALSQARGNGMGGISIRELLIETAEARGVGRVRGTGLTEQQFAAAIAPSSAAGRGRMEFAGGGAQHTTGDFADLFLSTTQRAALSYAAMTVVSYPAWTGATDVQDFRGIERIKMSELGTFEQIREGQMPGLTTFKTSKEGGRVLSFARGISFTYEMAINDDLGVIEQQVQTMGMSWPELIEDLSWAALTATAMSDTHNLISSQHGNVGTDALSHAALDTARSTMLGYAGLTSDNDDAEANNRTLNVQPTVILVGNKTLSTALRLYNAEKDPTAGAGNNSSAENMVRGWVRPVLTGKLRNKSSWIVTGDPRFLPVLRMRLRGQEDPTMFRAAHDDPRALKMWWIGQAGAMPLHDKGVYASLVSPDAWN